MPAKVIKNELIDEFNIIHKFKYDYSLIGEFNGYKKIKIICREHGEFEQIYSNHLKGHGCPDCSNNKKYTTLEFNEKAGKIHNYLYDYSLVNYINSHIKVKIICKEHGEFQISPNNHISKRQGCPDCYGSLGEKRILLFLNKNNITNIKEKIFKECVSIKPLRFDFYLPDYNMCIEFDGRQHYVKNWKFGNEDSFNKLKERDKIKNEYCSNNNIRLLRISYKDINRIEDILLEFIKF